MMPIVYSLKGKRLLIIGAGTIARRKLNTLKAYTSDITVLSPSPIGEQIHWIEDTFKEDYLKYYDLVFACTDDAELNRQILLACQNTRALCSNCSDGYSSDFYLPAIIKKEMVTAVVSTSGYAPGITKELKASIKTMITDELVERIDLIQQIRQIRKANKEELSSIYQLSIEEMKEEIENASKSRNPR
jgi:precorrin-2 dehydrogenase/sirohydrochlorin ferrochelatase